MPGPPELDCNVHILVGTIIDSDSNEKENEEYSTAAETGTMEGILEDRAVSVILVQHPNT